VKFNLYLIGRLIALPFLIPFCLFDPTLLYSIHSLISSAALLVIISMTLFFPFISNFLVVGETIVLNLFPVAVLAVAVVAVVSSN